MEKDLKSEPNDFTWPPPDHELDALEQLFISDDSRGLPATRPTTEVAPTPRVDEATQLAHRGHVVARRQTAKRLAVTMLPWVAAMAIGALLGERQARINRTEFVMQEKSASGERAATASPPVTRAVPGLTTQAPAAPQSPSRQASPVLPRESPVPATMPAPASRSRSTSEAANVTRELAATSARTAAPVSAAAARQEEVALSPTPAREPTGIDKRPVARETAPVAAPDAAFVAASPVPAPAEPPRPVAPIIPIATATTAAAISRLVTLSDHAGIRRALQMYEDAYERLDAHAAAAVWPSLDVPALTRAFEGLKEQRLQFDRCDFTVGFGTATAVCSGAAQIVRRIGNPDPLVERRNWTFHLKRADSSADWKIDSVSTSR